MVDATVPAQYVPGFGERCFAVDEIQKKRVPADDVGNIHGVMRTQVIRLAFFLDQAVAGVGEGFYAIGGQRVFLTIK